MAEDSTTAAFRTKRAVIAALTANIAIALMKFTVAVFVNSSALLAEGFHSLADTSNQAFLLLGIKLSARPADRIHPFGHGKERYFWAFVVSLSPSSSSGPSSPSTRGSSRSSIPSPCCTQGGGIWSLHSPFASIVIPGASPSAR